MSATSCGNKAISVRNVDGSSSRKINRISRRERLLLATKKKTAFEKIKSRFSSRDTSGYIRIDRKTYGLEANIRFSKIRIRRSTRDGDGHTRKTTIYLKSLFGGSYQHVQNVPGRLAGEKFLDLPTGRDRDDQHSAVDHVA